MIALQIARMITHFVLFFETSSENIVDPRASVKMMEGLIYDLEQLDRKFLRELVDAFPIIAPEYGPQWEESVRTIPYGFYLEETLAEGDPVRLAELEAIRDAEPPMDLNDLPTWPMKPAS